MSLLSILGAPISALVNSVGGIISQFHASDTDKLAAQTKLQELESAFQEKLLEADAQFAEMQEKVIVAEAQGGSWMQRNWRPLIMLSFGYIIFHNYVLAPLFGIPSVIIVPDMWQLLKLGITGYVAGRSLEKIVPQVADVLSQNKK